MLEEARQGSFEEPHTTVSNSTPAPIQEEQKRTQIVRAIICLILALFARMMRAARAACARARCIHSQGARTSKKSSGATSKRTFIVAGSTVRQPCDRISMPRRDGRPRLCGFGIAIDILTAKKVLRPSVCSKMTIVSATRELVLPPMPVICIGAKGNETRR